MSDEIKALMAQAPFSFVGTVLHLGAATTTQVPIDDRTAVVSVDHVLHAPDAFKHLDGHQITVQLSATIDPPAVGESAAFFVQGVSFGESIVVAEVGRLPVESVAPHAQAAVDAGKPAGAFEGLAREIQQADLRAHMEGADAVIVGRVVGLEKAHQTVRSEHDPHWWRATIEVDHVERGEVSGPTVQVLYANSLDVRWHRSPKPKAGQSGVWILHKTDAALQDLAPFQMVHPEDMQPTQQLDVVRTTGD
jgi:hypothetical protein